LGVNAKNKIILCCENILILTDKLRAALLLVQNGSLFKAIICWNGKHA